MELQQKWAELDQRWIHYLEQLTDESMEELVGKSSTSSGKGRVHRTKRSDVLLHVCTHAQYTTAQIVNMLRQVGATSLLNPMLITLAQIQMVAFVD
ncbi:DinB family protein [uncultured Gimesia sp.]|uniref:DinB family protein n=1 Tax=uncultured Gimesia sp. TaxID=1678688 RepID=UPI0026054560|nr:DinB family protein [uncultured Gimesia sp.]